MKLMQILRRFARASGGQAGLEFALIAPFIMVPLLLGSIDLLDMLQANRRAQNAAASVADVVSRDTSISDAEVEGLWDAATLLMYPDDGSPLEVRITSVRVISAESAIVAWSETNDTDALPALTADDPFTDLTPAMMQSGTTVIVTDTQYPYHSPLGFLVANEEGMTLSHTAYRRSRLVDPLPRVD